MCVNFLICSISLILFYFLIELAAVEEKFPNFKSTLLNCFIKVSNHMKDANFIVRPSFKRINKGSLSKWQATYNLKWPEPKEFSGIGPSRSEAEKLVLFTSVSTHL